LKIDKKTRNKSNNKREEGKDTKRATRVITISLRTVMSQLISIATPTKIGMIDKEEETRNIDPNDV
jgi:hypothetical protein